MEKELMNNLLKGCISGLNISDFINPYYQKQNLSK